jgi:hypothetical protein
MSTTTQADFAAALTNTALPVPEGLASWNGVRPERRFGVYRNNVAAGLIGALASRFPATERIVGEAFFAAMARDYIDLHPPRTPLLLAYGDDFPDFIEGVEPARELAYLPDIARLEAARGRAHHAADVAPLDAAALAAVEPERLADVTFVAHPSAGILRSPHPCVTIWAMNAGEMELGPIEDWQAEAALIVRPEMTVEIHRLPPGGAAFLGALLAGASLGEAFEAAVGDAPAFDLSANLVGALSAGAFTAIRQPETGS